VPTKNRKGASMSDMINSPPHYNQGNIECLDAIEAMLSVDGFIDYLRGQVIKYNWRLPYKDSALEDASKAKFYQDRLVFTLEMMEARRG
jgi:hypothetical protein